MKNETSFDKAVKFSQKYVLGISHLTHKGHLSGGRASPGVVTGFFQVVFVRGLISWDFWPEDLCPDNNTFLLSDWIKLPNIQQCKSIKLD